MPLSLPLRSERANKKKSLGFIGLIRSFISSCLRRIEYGIVSKIDLKFHISGAESSKKITTINKNIYYTKSVILILLNKLI